MKTIKIVGGGYGCRKPSGGTKLIMTGQTVEVDDAEAKRLCELGIAEEATDAPETAPETGNNTEQAAAPESERKQTRKKPVRK